MVQGGLCTCNECGGKYTLLNNDEEDPRLTMFDRPLPFFGCGVGWCSFLLGFLCPLLWYIAGILYFIKYYNRDPRERAGLAACAVTALACTIAILIILAVIFI